MKKATRLLIICAVMMVFASLAACGQSDSSSQKPDSNSSSDQNESAAATLNVTAKDFEFNKSTYKVPANKKVKINFKSVEGTHGFEIEGTDVNLQGKGTATVTLKPGTYHVHCSIPCGQGHQNMKATIIAQ